MGTTGSGTVVSVNVGRPRTVRWHGRRVKSGIWKVPVPGPVEVAGENLAGDGQADRRIHGGADKAVYAYAAEDYRWWSEALGRPLDPGTFGENLTTEGLDLLGAHVGDQWSVGTCVLQVTQPRTPCFKLGIRMGDDRFPELFAAARRPGVYLRVVQSGAVAAGDSVSVTSATRPAVPIAALAGDEVTAEVLRLAAADDRLPPRWRRSALRALEALERA